MAPIKLPCPKSGCGWTTVEVELPDAKDLLADHIRLEHEQTATVDRSGGGKCKPDRMVRPSAELEMSETTWRDFKGQWDCYKRSTKLAG